jgi:hypothetical protein
MSGGNNWGPFNGGSNAGPFSGGNNWGPFNGRWFFYCAEINQQPVILVNYLVAFKVCALAVASA